jgi:hypothetical protein
VIAPVPVPVLPPVNVSQASLLAAVHWQELAEAVTATLPLDAAAPDDTLVGDSVNVHGTPACVTVNVWPAIVIVPIRDAALVFAVIE